MADEQRDEVITEEDIADESEALVYLQDLMRKSKQDLIDGIIRARDHYGMTFREIGEVMGISHSWVFKLYRRGKK